MRLDMRVEIDGVVYVPAAASLDRQALDLVAVAAGLAPGLPLDDLVVAIGSSRRNAEVDAFVLNLREATRGAPAWTVPIEWPELEIRCAGTLLMLEDEDAEDHEEVDGVLLVGSRDAIRAAGALLGRKVRLVAVPEPGTAPDENANAVAEVATALGIDPSTPLWPESPSLHRLMPRTTPTERGLPKGHVRDQLDACVLLVPNVVEISTPAGSLGKRQPDPNGILVGAIPWAWLGGPNEPECGLWYLSTEVPVWYSEHDSGQWEPPAGPQVVKGLVVRWDGVLREEGCDRVTRLRGRRGSVWMDENDMDGPELDRLALLLGATVVRFGGGS